MEKSSSEEDVPVDETDVSPSTTAASIEKPGSAPPSLKPSPIPLSKESQQESKPKNPNPTKSDQDQNDQLATKQTATEEPVRKRKLEKLQLEVTSRKLPKVVTDIRSIMSAMSAGDIVPALGLAVGDELEVLWVLEDETEEEKESEQNGESSDKGYEHWWKCTVCAKQKEVHQIEEAGTKADIAVYTLKYVPLNENLNYQEETCSNVCFLGETSLYDIEYNKVLQWRLAQNDRETGTKKKSIRNPVLLDAVQRFARENNIKKFEKRNALEHLQAIAPDEVIPIPEGQTKQASETLVNAIIANVFAAHLSQMNKLPVSTQFSMADKVSAVKNILVEKIAECLETKKILDAAAVHEIIADMTPQLRKLQES